MRHTHRRWSARSVTPAAAELISMISPPFLASFTAVDWPPSGPSSITARRHRTGDRSRHDFERFHALGWLSSILGVLSRPSTDFSNNNDDVSTLSRGFSRLPWLTLHRRPSAEFPIIESTLTFKVGLANPRSIQAPSIVGWRSDIDQFFLSTESTVWIQRIHCRFIFISWLPRQLLLRPFSCLLTRVSVLCTVRRRWSTTTACRSGRCRCCRAGRRWNSSATTC